jgi:hypothetical protein
VVDDFDKLREGLRAMPVPEPRPGFVERALAKATVSAAPPRRESRGLRALLARPLVWGAAAAGALAASLVWFVVLAARVDTPQQPSLQLALHESREISLVIDSERALEGATIRLYATGSVALAGYEDQAEIQWLASLNQGANLLSLPVVAREPGQGSIVAEIEHQGKTRRVNVLLQVRG